MFLWSFLRKFFARRSPAFNVSVLVLAGALAFGALSLASSSLRSVYWGIAQYRVINPLQQRAKASSEAKQRALEEKKAAEKNALRQAAREASSLSSPYVEVAADERFPLLVRVWLNADPSHTARVSNNDERFPLVYERALSTQGFVPIVGLAFGDNNFDIEIRDAGGEKVAQHSLRAMIEDTEGVQDWLEVHKKPARNDFVSVIVPWGSLFARPPKQKYVAVVDDLGSVRWVYRWAGSPQRGRAGYPLLSETLGDRLLINDDEGIKVVSTDVFGNTKVIFDGESYSQKHDYKVHHGVSATDKGTLLLIADPIQKGGVPLPKQPKILSEEDTILEIDLKSGKILREIDLKKVFAENSKRPMLEDQGILPPKKKDWMHLNAIHYDKASETIVLSGRNQSAVFALDYDTAALAWIFADPEGWPDRASLPLLKAPRGYRYHRGQHDVKLEGDRLRFFDNSVLVKDSEGRYIPASAMRSRIVEAKLDLANARVASVATYAPENFFSKITGGYEFRDGRYLLCYCGMMKDVFGKYVNDFRNSKGVDGEAQLFEFDQGSNQKARMHFSIKGISYRPRYFDWLKMVGAR